MESITDQQVIGQLIANKLLANQDHFFTKRLDLPADGRYVKVNKLANEIPEVLIKNKRVLVIGSHDGVMSIILTLRYTPKLVIGIDLDGKLVNKANCNLQDCFNQGKNVEMIE